MNSLLNSVSMGSHIFNKNGEENNTCLLHLILDSQIIKSVSFSAVQTLVNTPEISLSLIPSTTFTVMSQDDDDG